MKLKDYFKVTQLIHKSMIAGMIILLVIFKVAIPQTEQFPFDEKLSTLILGISIVLVLVSITTFSKNCAKVRSEHSLLKKLTTYRAQFIIQMALLEIATVLNMIGWVLGAGNIHLYLSLVILVYAISKSPTKQNVYKMVFEPDDARLALEDDERMVELN